MALLGALIIGAAGGYISGKNTASSAARNSLDEASTRTRGPARIEDAATGAEKKSSRKMDPTSISQMAGNSNRIQALLAFYADLSPQQLAEEAAKLENLPMNERLMASFLLFGRWAEVDPDSAIAFSNTMGMAGGFVRPTILQSWASVDPVKAAKYYLQNPREFAMMDMMGGGGRGPMGGQGASSIIASEWARQDPLAAMKWASDLENGKTQAMTSVISEVAKTDPKKASELLSKMDLADRAGGYRVVASQYGATDFPGASAWIQSLPAADQAEARAAAIAGLASKDPREALLQVNKMAAGDAKDRAISAMVKDLGRLDPQAASTLVNSQKNEQFKRDALRELMPTWTNQNPKAAYAYVQTLAAGPVRDSAAQAWVFSNTTSPPAEIITVAESITDDGDRQRSVGVAAMRWMREDATAAKAYIQSSNSIPADAKQRLMDGGSFWGGGGGGRGFGRN